MGLIRFNTSLLALWMASVSVFASQWDYEGEHSPERWGKISEEYKLCQTGMNQSPVNINATRKLEHPALKVEYIDGPTTLLSINHTLQATFSSYASDILEIDGQLYTLENIDFHTPSEHTIRGKHYAMEMHLTHKNQHGDIVIVAVMFQPGDPNPAIQSLWQSFPTMEGSSMPLFIPVDINQLLPEEKTYWRYSGSLTTPPCSEEVTWLILKTPVTVSAEQLAKFQDTIRHSNNRPVQALNEREVTE